MKTFLFFILAGFFVTTAKAQILVDKPVPTGVGDQVFQSSYDPMVGYYFPPQLVNLSQPNIVSIGDEHRLFLNVGVLPATVDDINQRIAKSLPGKKAPVARIMRGYNVKVVQQSLHIPPQFRPHLSVIGDAGNLAGPVNYLLTIRKGYYGGVGALTMLKMAFQNGWHLGTLSYEYVAIIGGATEMAKTNVGIWASAPPAKKFMLSPDAVPGMKVELDSITKCWDKTTEGIICIKK